MRTKVIADLTSNHLGSLEIMECMIKALAEHGVDIVKTQSWRADKLRTNVKDFDSNFDYYKKHQLSQDDHFKVKQLCDKYGVEMLTTCFDIDNVDFLASLGLKTIKVASPDAASYRMIKALLDKFENLIISTGAAKDEELQETFSICKGKNVVFLHCKSIYPCPLEKVDMSRMLYFKELGLRYGYSDHTLGTEAARYAVCLGAEVVEKHFTLNRYLPGRDQAMSTTMEEFAEIVDWTKKVELMMGEPHPALHEEELKVRQNYIGKWGNNR